MNILQGSQNTHVQNLVAYHVEGGLHHQSLTISADSQRSVSDILQPITDASHARDRKRSPPDSACFPGTRLQVVKGINAWARTDIASDSEPHMRWMHGYVGSGKSSISQEVCDTSDREERPVISFFFFRNAGDRSKIWRLATTLATQMAAVIPQTEPFIREAVRANPALLAPDEKGVSVRIRMQCLVYAPFKKLVRKKKRVRALTQGPFLIVLDGLDECDNKDEVQELIDGMLMFFNENPLIPLRVFVTSRVEEHIQSRLNVPGVWLDNLVDHCTDDDIATFLHILFEDACRRNSVVRAYVQQFGEWPTQSDRRKLVEHIGGSFIFASAVFKFIMATSTEASGPSTPMDRLPLALKMNPGLDGLYTQTLARSMHLPHFSNIISTIALLVNPLPTSGLAELLGIQTYEVVNVLVNLQAIIQVPGTDDIPVTLCHTSLRDFLTTQSRSRDFFAHPSHHVRIFFRCLECQLKHLRQDPDLFTLSTELIPAGANYAHGNLLYHLEPGRPYFEPTELDSAVHLCREATALQPGFPKQIEALAYVSLCRGRETSSLTDLDEAISLWRAVLELRPSPHPDLPYSLNCLASVLVDRHQHTGCMFDLEEAVSLHRKALTLAPSPHPSRSSTIYNLADALRARHRCTGAKADLEEAISLYREALELQPSPHPGRCYTLNRLGDALQDRHRLAGSRADLDEAISLHREALELRPSPHPERSSTLYSLGYALQDYYRLAGFRADLEEAISLRRVALELQPSPHPERSFMLDSIGYALQDRHRLAGSRADLEEAISLHREALELRPSPHPNRSFTLDILGDALHDRHRLAGSKADLEEAIFLHREALELLPSPHPERSFTLNSLGDALQDRHRLAGSRADLEESISLFREALEGQPSFRSLILRNLTTSLQSMFGETGTFSHLQDAIAHCEELLVVHRPVGHPDRAECLRLLSSLLQLRFDATGQEDDLSRISTLEDEANRLSAPSTDDSIP